jgi:ubiquinone/menaquinone biosynthesis C-methylase UbiE
MERTRAFLSGRGLRRQPVGPLALLTVLAVLAAAAATPDITAEAERLLKVLELQPGATVADIAAGSGEMSVALAKLLGPSSRVYATDINQERLREIGQASVAAGLTNVIPLEGHPTQTNLPDACCDAAFVRYVYHHFGDPPAMNANIRRALKPGGRFAVLDAAPKKSIDGLVPPALRASGDTHGVAAQTVVEELEAAGFTNVRIVTREWPGDLFLVLARDQ